MSIFIFVKRERLEYEENDCMLCGYVDRRIDYYVKTKKISYFVEEKLNVIPNGFLKDKVFSYEKLLEENKDNVIIIISNSKRYGECAERLTQMGFIENEHFFNGWKLHINYYKKIDELISWEDDEKSKQDVFCNTAWEKRAEFMASMIPSDVKSIMDIGCGDKKLKKYLNQDIKYYGLDFAPGGVQLFVM